MYIQNTPIPNQTLNRNFSPLAHFSIPLYPRPVINQHQRLGFCSKSRPGSFNSAKRVSSTSNSLKTHGCLARGHFDKQLYSVVDQVQTFKLNLKSASGIWSSFKMASRTRIGETNSGGLVSVRCGVSEEVHDEGYYMRRCVELARKAIGCTSPNPMVGCLIVKDGKIVGEGFHPKAGQPHAEVFALRNAGDLAENATAYVTLEPCNHYGRTPPCTEALIKAKVKKVIVGMVDPNPIVASKGVQRLRDAGIEVVVCVEEELCKKLNEAYIHKMLTGNPFVTIRYSISVNGHILNQLGEKAMEPGGYYSQLLQEYDVVVYSSAVLNELYFPASKEHGANQPLQVILAKCPSSHIQLPDVNSSKVIIFTEKEADVEPEIAKTGVEIVASNSMRLTSILEHCKRQGLCSVLLDLRGDSGDFEQILREGFEQNLFQKVVAEMKPIWGGSQDEKWKNVGQTLPLMNLTTRYSSNGIVLEGYFC